jgi:N utilization substance protein B
MAKITRQEARELLFALLFETEFHDGKNPSEIYDLAEDNREIPADKYIRETFFGINSKNDVLDEVIGKYSRGWKADRLSKVSRSVLRIAVYEMLFVEDIPMNVSISQAVELSVKYGEDKAKQFVNGVLSGLFKDIQTSGNDAIIAEAVEAMNKRAEEAEVPAEADEAEAAENTDGEDA